MKNNILLLSSGRRVSLAIAFRDALKSLDIDGRLICADMNPSMSAACNYINETVILPHVSSQHYIDELLSVCISKDIKIVVPTIDTELLKLAEAKEVFLKSGIYIVVSDYSLVKKCRDKRETNKLFYDIGIPVPETYSLDAIKYPCFAKPISGSLSKDIRILHTSNELNSWNVNKDEMMFMEVISNDEFDEYTIDTYYGLDGQLKCLVPRKRIEIRGGEVSKGITDKDIISNLHQPLSLIKGAFGCLTIQIFKSKTSELVYGIEINARFGGGYPLSYFAGANYPLMLITEILLNNQINYEDNWEDNLMMLRYDAEVLVHGNKN